jgi:hypothetical protein
MGKFLASLLVITLALSSCSDQSGFQGQRESTFVRYKLVYDNAKYQTVASTEFFDYNENGKKLNLNISAKPVIRYNNSRSQIEFSERDLMYYKVFPGKITSLTSAYEFTANTQPYSNYLILPNPVSLPSSFNSLVKSDGLSLTFSGNLVDANEKVVLKIGDLVFENSTISSNKFELSAQDLQSLPIGNVVANISRIKRLDATDAAPAGGIKQTEYVSGEKIITVF